MNFKRYHYFISIIIVLIVCWIVFLSQHNKYMHKLSSQDSFMFFHAAVYDFYDKYGYTPSGIYQIDSLIPIYITKRQNLYNKIQIKKSENNIRFCLQSSLKLDSIGRLKWPYIIKKNQEFFLFQVELNRPPLKKFRVEPLILNEKELSEKVNELINSFQENFDYQYCKKGIDLYYEDGDYILNYSQFANMYFYSTNYKTDTIGEKFLLSLKYILEPLLETNEITRLEVPIRTPRFSPLPVIQDCSD